MRARIAIIAALPREVSGLVKGWRADGWRADRESAARNIHVYSKDSIIVVCAGMGATRALVGAGEAFARGPVSKIISAGLAGALYERWKCGQIVRPAGVIDAKTGERFLAEGGDGTLVTGSTVAGVSEKLRLRSSYGAEIVDMEAAAVARAAAQRGVPFAAIKAVSDEYDFELPELGNFATEFGQFREAAFAAFAVTHPRVWKKAVRLAHGSRMAVRALTRELQDEVARQNT